MLLEILFSILVMMRCEGSSDSALSTYLSHSQGCNSSPREFFPNVYHVKHSENDFRMGANKTFRSLVIKLIFQ